MGRNAFILLVVVILSLLGTVWVALDNRPDSMPAQRPDGGLTGEQVSAPIDRDFSNQKLERLSDDSPGEVPAGVGTGVYVDKPRDVVWAGFEVAWEEGDADAAYAISELFRSCAIIDQGKLKGLEDAIDSEVDPEERQRLKAELERIERYDAFCDDVDINNHEALIERVHEWRIKAADAGHVDAMMDVIGMHPSDFLLDEDRGEPDPEKMAAFDVRRKVYLEALRERCHILGLNTLGNLIAADRVFYTSELDKEVLFYQTDASLAIWQDARIQAFAHRLAAARKTGAVRPEAHVRSMPPQASLTAREELHAGRIADAILADCTDS